MDFNERVYLEKIHFISANVSRVIHLLSSSGFWLKRQSHSHHSIPRHTSTIKSSSELKKISDELIVADGFELSSFDVVLLFSNIPSDLILQALTKKWKFLRNKINLSKVEFLEGIRLLLDSTYLQFNNKFYIQIMCASMGFCTSPWFADITLELLETFCLNKHKNKIRLFKRYVDDCILITNKDKTDEILASFNSYNEHLKFTIERENNKNIIFLDIKLIKTDNSSIITNWYRKNTASGCYINYLSHHPQSQKIAIIYNLIDKSIKLKQPQFHQKNLNIVKHYLRYNSYPEHIINKYIKSRLKAIENDFSQSNLTNKRAVLLKDKVVLSFIKHLTPKINHILHKHNIVPINKTINKFNNIITVGKDRLDKSDTYGIVYKIDCQNCSSTYIGMSKRKLKKRTCEYDRAVQIAQTTMH